MTKAVREAAGMAHIALDEVERLRTELAAEREKFLMHTAEVGAWLSALADVFGVKATTVKDSCSQIYDAAKTLKTAVAAERERCALVARDTIHRIEGTHNSMSIRFKVADAIRQTNN